MTDEEILATADACGMMLFGLGLDKAKFEFCILAFAKQIAKLERHHEREAIERHEANVQKFLGAPQPEQEPVAVVDANDEGYWADILPDRNVKVGQLLYTTPPQRTEQEPVKIAHRHEWFRTGEMKVGQMRCISCGTWGHEEMPQRTWVGLAAEDRLTAKYMQDAPDGIEAVIDYIENKLKEKNT